MGKNSEDDLVEIPSVKLNLKVKCGECAFFKNAAVYGKPCEVLGRPASSDPCRLFLPDTKVMRDDNIKLLRIACGIKKPHAIAAAIIAAQRVSRHGFLPGQKVYWKILGGDFLSNYASGIVIGSAKDLILVCGDQSITALVKPTTLLNRAQWDKKLASLLRRDAINDPDGGLRRVVTNGKMKLVAYEPRPFGFVLEKRGRRKTAAKKRGRKPSVITLR